MREKLDLRGIEGRTLAMMASYYTWRMLASLVSCNPSWHTLVHVYINDDSEAGACSAHRASSRLMP
jgi:hypothetical protein